MFGQGIYDCLWDIEVSYGEFIFVINGFVIYMDNFFFVVKFISVEFIS